ncbi:MAG: hypothetical protein ABWY10_11240, partial [Tardiphaga sp.]
MRVEDLDPLIGAHGRNQQRSKDGIGNKDLDRPGASVSMKDEKCMVGKAQRAHHNDVSAGWWAR